ncbi:unnamed protein product [Mycena citricolor]|uniref:Uncharacterized protein n=1 Tax=Mycena citricolor TaxID=2018698 RepID=A0AAD2GZ56_9AGAR|nr:unnamed protein product [Mycena citricolor]
MAHGEGTTSTKTEKGSIAPEAQSLEKEEAPKESAEIKVPEAPKRTRVPDAVQRKLAAKKQKGPQPSRLAQESRSYQAKRKRHSMDVYVQITGLDSGKTPGVKALLDSGCSTCCIDTDYAQAEKLDIQELPQPIDLEEGESILLVDFGKEVDLRLKETPGQKFAEEAEKEKERMTEGKIPDQYREFVKWKATLEEPSGQASAGPASGDIGGEDQCPTGKRGGVDERKGIWYEPVWQ